MEPRRREVLHAGPLEVRTAEHIAYVNGRPLSLTPRELDVLAALVRHEGGVVTRDELYAEVWGHNRSAVDRSVDVYVRRLRAKLARALPEWAFIHTHFALGYRLSAERPSDLRAPRG